MVAASQAAQTAHHRRKRIPPRCYGTNNGRGQGLIEIEIGEVVGRDDLLARRRDATYRI
jgi:hypothetical protein